MRQLKITKSITNRESASLERYLQEIGKMPLLSAEEEVELSRSARAGNARALDKLVNGNLRFVVSVAKQYQNQGLALPDLINEGNLGLIKAALRFDESRGFKFISYAVWWVRQSILQALAEQSRIVRLPLNKVGLTQRISQAWQQLEQSLEREPSAQEIAESLDIPLEEVSATLRAGFRHVSMDTPLSAEEDLTLMDLLVNPNADAADETLVRKDSLCQDIKQCLSSLTDRQKCVLCYFYGIGVEQALSLEDIGAMFHLTRERVRQIKDKALTKLRTQQAHRHLRFYLG
ncbi:MAG: RNA polymerase sigma factor RpoD/SigA [Sphingobacteriia bacterium]|nr:MAG: RNA polymerase sigma factor RpoD/SigA [Sphingobacteriia bacterium]